MEFKPFSSQLKIAIAIVTIPLLLTAGCASNGVQTDSNYVAQEDSVISSDIVAASNSTSSESNTSTDLTGTDMTETSSSDLAQDETTEIASQTETDMKTVVDDEMPTNRVLHFNFDKSEVSDNDMSILKQHAEYLVAHPKFILSIDGHTDNRGPKHYNEKLSQTRARIVSTILVGFGAPESQLVLNNFGAMKPVEDTENWHQNRRVELSYSELYMVSK